MKDLIKKILDWIANIPHDKLLHMDMGQLIDLYSIAIVFRFVGLWWGLLIGWAIATALLVFKEIYDSKNKGSVEVADVLWGEVGIALIDIALIIALA